MSLLRHYQLLQEQAASLSTELQALESRDEFKKEKDFLDKLKGLMQEFDKSGGDVLRLLSPGENSSETPARRKKRKLKVYRNPNSGETVETRGGNHKILKQWKDQHGAETVDSWLIEEK